MENKNILLVSAAIIFILVLAGGAMIYSQQKSIDKLNAQMMAGKTPQSSLAGAVSKNTASTVAEGLKSVEGMRAEAEDKGNFIVGKITAISGGNLTVEADNLIDFDKMKEAASAQNADFAINPPTVKKTFSVSTNGGTEFMRSKLADLHVGDGIWVNTKEKVYQTDKITALQLVSPYEAPKVPK
jgi:hypothetical protein